MGDQAQRRVALVTGAGGGIGRAVVTSLARSGSICVALDLDLERAAAAVSAVGPASGAEAIACDVTDAQAAHQAVQGALERYGRIDVLVNGAGWPGPPMSATRVSREDWRRTMDINYHGTVQCTIAAIPAMKRQRAGRVINIASMSATQGARGQAAYSGSKAAVLGFTFALAKELLAHRVTVNAVTPGFIRTPMMDLPAEISREWRIDRTTLGGEMGEPEDVADLIAFLASSRARYITGAVIPIDGGAHLGFP
jgi:NAD(P)-dependent dehydrogenase (short-subunit alcohol dehydrogenase family)